MNFFTPLKVAFLFFCFSQELKLSGLHKYEVQAEDQVETKDRVEYVSKEDACVISTVELIPERTHCETDCGSDHDLKECTMYECKRACPD